jgi:hypothetical protein
MSRPTLIARNSDVFGVVALATVTLAGLAFVISVLARLGSAAEYAALAVYLGAVAIGAFTVAAGTRGRAAGIASLVVAALAGSAMVLLVLVRSAYNAEGPA